MPGDTVSSGYISGDSTAVGYDNNNPGENGGKGSNHSKRDGEFQTQSETPDIMSNTYHRITKFDDEIQPQGSRQASPYNIIPFDEVNGKRPVSSSGNRPLPNLPGGMGPESKEFRKKRSRWCLIAIVVVPLVLLMAGAVLYARISCFKELLCSKEKGCLPDQDCRPVHSCDVDINTNYNEGGHTECDLQIQNITALIIRSPRGMGIAEIQTINGSINLTMEGLEISLNTSTGRTRVEISIPAINCSTIGTHYVTLSDGAVNETFKVNVKVNPTSLQCPCDKTIVVAEKRTVTCSAIPNNDVNVTVILRGGSSDVTLANDISIAHILQRNGSLASESDENVFLVATNDNSNAKFNIEFSPVKCSHAGTYEISIGNMTYETDVNVTSNPQKPKIRVDHDNQGGLIYGQKGEIQCEAFVGCGTQPMLYEFSEGDGFLPVANTKTREKSSTEGMRYYVAITDDDANKFNGKTYKCNYTIDGKAMESDEFTARVIPDKWCKNNNIRTLCHGNHPYDCNKFITCSTRAIEQLCNPGQHFYFENPGDCQGKCDFPHVANCPIHN